MEQNIAEDGQLSLSKSVVYYAALYLASQNGNRAIVKYISELPIKPSKDGLFEFTAIYYAAQNGSLSMFVNAFRTVLTGNEREIVDTSMANHTIDESNVITDSNICKEASSAPETTKNVIHTEIQPLRLVDWNEQGQQTFKLPKLVDEQGYTALHTAVKTNNLDKVNMLCENGANVNFKIKTDICTSDDEGKTPIHLACEIGNYNVVAKLLKHGGDFEIKDSNGNVPLYYAAKTGAPLLVKLLLDKGANINTLNNLNHMVISEATDDIVIKLLLRRGLDYKRIDEHGLSILHNAAYFDNDILIEFFLKSEFYVDFEHKNENGVAPLAFAAYFNKCNAMNILLECGADIQSVNNNGESALYVAAHRGSFLAVKLLLGRGANVDAQTLISKQTPLIAAVKNNHIDIVRLLLLHKADVHITDSEDKCALGYVIDIDKTEIIELLLTRYTSLASTHR